MCSLILLQYTKITSYVRVFPQQEASICSYLNAQEPSSETKAYQSSVLLARCYGVIKNAAVATV